MNDMKSPKPGTDRNDPKAPNAGGKVQDSPAEIARKAAQEAGAHSAGKPNPMGHDVKATGEQPKPTGEHNKTPAGR
jgi:hypothetical protein